MGKVKTRSIDKKAFEDYRERVADCWRMVRPYCVDHEQGAWCYSLVIEFVNSTYERIFLPKLKEVLYLHPIEDNPPEPFVYYFYNGEYAEMQFALDVEIIDWFKQHYPEYVKEIEEDG